MKKKKKRKKKRLPLAKNYFLLSVHFSINVGQKNLMEEFIHFYVWFLLDKVLLTILSILTRVFIQQLNFRAFLFVFSYSKLWVTCCLVNIFGTHNLSRLIFVKTNEVYDVKDPNKRTFKTKQNKQKETLQIF